MAQRKSYFLAPNFDSPPDGPIRLGNILISPFKPEESLIPPSLPLSIAIYSTTNENWYAEKGASSNTKIGIYAKFIDIVTGIGADASISRDKSTVNKYEFSRVETHFFVPSEEFVQEMMANPKVKEFLVKKKFRENVYMITGIKTAFGAKVTKTKTKGRGGAFKGGFDGSAALVPVEAGPDINFSTKGNETSGFEGGDFVFAYRLKEIAYRKRQVRSNDFDKGALLGLEKKFKELKKDVEATAADVEVLGISEDDVGAEDVDANG